VFDMNGVEVAQRLLQPIAMDAVVEAKVLAKIASVIR
jgi:hypothetical protein